MAYSSFFFKSTGDEMNALAPAVGGRLPFYPSMIKPRNEGETGDDTTPTLNRSSEPNSDERTVAPVEEHPLSAQEKLNMPWEADSEGIEENLSDNTSCGGFIDILIDDFEAENIQVLPGNKEAGENSYWYGAIEEVGNSEFKKNQLYLSKPAGPLCNLNQMACFRGFPGTKAKIVCHHLAAQFIKDTLEKGEVDFKFYSTVESITEHIPIEMDTVFTTLKNNAKRYNLIKNDHLGKHLYACFEDMCRKAEKVRALLIICPIHSMAISLYLKGTQDEPLYVIRSYDPYRTNAAICCETQELESVASYSLKQFMDGTNSTEDSLLYKAHYGEVEPISLIMECDSAIFNGRGNTSKKIKELEMLEDDFPLTTQLTATYIHFLLAENFVQDFVNLQKELLASDKLFDLLAAKNKEGKPGLIEALQRRIKTREATEAYRAFFDESLLSEKLRGALGNELEKGKSFLERGESHYLEETQIYSLVSSFN